MPHLYEIKNEILRGYPSLPFEATLCNHRQYLSYSKPEWKGVISLLKEYESDFHDKTTEIRIRR
jgi:hypothetical protein